MKHCPVCAKPVDAPPPETICNPHNCPSWEVTHVYDRKTRSWVPEKGAADVDK